MTFKFDHIVHIVVLYFFLCHYFQICEASSLVCCFHGNTECSRPPLGLGSARWHHGVSLLVRRYRQIEYYLLKSSECANYQLHADYVMFFALFICKWINWYGWKYTPILIYMCAEIFFALKVLGHSVGLCKTTKRKGKLFIILLVDVWRIICENFNPIRLILAEIWMKI